MEWYVLLSIALAAVVAAVLLFTLAPAIIIDRAVFGSRQDKREKFKYFTPEEFSLNTEVIPVSYCGVNLHANIYTVKPVEECGAVVVFAHGFGAGTSSYMTEIAHFAKCGFAVVAADAYGCNNSAGKKIKGFYAGAEAVIAAYIAVKSEKRLKDKKVVLVGHSWGAYSVAAACGKVKADGVVAISGFNAPAQCLCDQLKHMGALGKTYAPLLHGWFWLFNIFKFGACGNTKAVNAVKKSGTKALAIHGEKDKTVPLKHSFAKLAEGVGAQVVMLADKRHNPYNTVAAEAQLASLTGAHNFANGEEEKAYFASFDWQAVTEEDAEVMATIDRFIANA